MSDFARRGRLIVLALLTLLVLDEFSSYGLGLFTAGFGGLSWRKHFVVIFTTWIAWSLWHSGSRLDRWCLSLLAVLRGLPNLVVSYLTVHVALAMSRSQERSSTEALWVIFMTPVGALSLIALIEVLTPAILWLPSVRSFLAFQEKEAHWKPAPFDNIEAWFASQRARPSYDALTLDLLRSLSPERCYTVVSEYLTELEDADLGQASPALQMVRAVNEVSAEVNNGGFHQYYWNTGGRRAFMAVEGYALLKQQPHRELLLKTIDVFLDEEHRQEQHRPEVLDEFVAKYLEARQESEMPQFDSDFYALPDLEPEITAYIQSHLSEFVHRKRS